MPDPPEPLIETPQALAELVDHLRHVGRFAFDTEFVSEETFEPVLCLVQVATTERLAIIDPLAISNLGPFWDVVTDPALEVVMHAAGEDLRICRIKTGRLPTRLFDVQLAAGLVGFAYPLSLGNLVHQVLGFSLAGGETRTDWRRRPLSPAQLRYALDDVRHLLDLDDRIRHRLAALGRSSWADDEMQGFLDQIARRAEDEPWRRLPGLHQLNRRSLEVARRMAQWRVEVARHTNRPVRQVLRDDLLVAVAKRMPANRRDLEALRDFNRPNLQRRFQEILDIVSSAREMPAENLPEQPERPEEAPGVGMLVNLLAAGLSRCCAQHKVAVGLVGTTSDLRELVRWHADGQPADQTPELAQGWRDQVCGQTLIDLLAGKLALRVADPGSEVPVALEPTAAKPKPDP